MWEEREGKERGEGQKEAREDDRGDGVRKRHGWNMEREKEKGRRGSEINKRKGKGTTDK